MFVSDIKENFDSYNLPQQFAEVLPEFCETCGAPMEISETLTGLHCSNPRCKDKMVMRIKALCNDLGILKFGESTIEKFIDYYEPDSPMDIFQLEEGMLLAPDVSPKISADVIRQIKEKRKMQLWEYVMFANIPFVRTSARKIFQGYKNLDDAYKDIVSGGLIFIQDRLGISEYNELSVQAMKVYNNLIEYKDDLYSGINDVEIVDLSNKKQLNVVCSDQVGNGFSKKSEFYAYINNTYADKLHVDFLSSVTKSIDYLVWAGADGTPARYTSKVQKVERYNEKGCNIPIVTAQQFIDIVENL
jgi:hypothetical protein